MKQNLLNKLRGRATVINLKIRNIDRSKIMLTNTSLKRRDAEIKLNYKSNQSIQNGCIASTVHEIVAKLHNCFQKPTEYNKQVKAGSGARNCNM